jgi:hypothetical protein
LFEKKRRGGEKQCMHLDFTCEHETHFQAAFLVELSLALKFLSVISIEVAFHHTHPADK